MKGSGQGLNQGSLLKRDLGWELEKHFIGVPDSNIFGKCPIIGRPYANDSFKGSETERKLASLTPVARLALGYGFDHHPITRLEVLDFIPDFSYHTAAFVPHDGPWRDQDPVQVSMDVRATNATVFDFQKDIRGLNLGSGLFLEFYFLQVSEDSNSHAHSPRPDSRLDISKIASTIPSTVRQIYITALWPIPVSLFN
jgi:hypothetical protein